MRPEPVGRTTARIDTFDVVQRGEHPYVMMPRVSMDRAIRPAQVRQAAVVAAALAVLVGASGPTSGAVLPLHVRMSYTKASGAVAVQGTTLPGTVVQVRNASAVVKSTGTYALRTALPVSLTAVRAGTIRRFRFDLPLRAKPYVSTLIVSADLTRMWSRIDGTLSMTEHPPATIVVHHVERGTTHRATLAKGNFAIGVPVAEGTNTLRWHLQVGPTRWPGPDIVYTAQ